jgi:hypothetical protein
MTPMMNIAHRLENRFPFIDFTSRDVLCLGGELKRDCKKL